MPSNWKASSRVRRRGHDIPSSSVSMHSNTSNGNNFDTATMTSTLPSLSIMEEEAMAGRVVISTSTIGEENRNDVLSEIIGNDIYADTKKSGGKCHKKFLAEDVLSEEQNHRDSYRSSLTGKVVTRCLNNRICKCFYNELKYWRKKLYDSKNARYRIRLWNTLQCLWFSALVLMIMTMLRLSNQIGASQENIEMKHMKALVSSAPRFTSHMGHSLPDVYSK